MARQRLSTWWSYTFCACTTQTINGHGMRASTIFNTATTRLSTARLATNFFRWSWDSNHYVPLMWPCHLQLLTQIQLISGPKQIRKTTSLCTSNIFDSRSMTFWRNQIPSTSRDMINIGCHTSFRWVTKFGCIFKRNTLPEQIWNLDHFNMDLTPLRRLWETMHLSSAFPHSLACTQCSMWTAFDHTVLDCLTHLTLQNNSHPHS